MPASPTIAKLRAENERLAAELARRDEAIRRVTAERNHFHEKVRLLLLKMYGRRTEKLDSTQLSLFVQEIERVRAEVGDDTSEPVTPEESGKGEGRSRGRGKPRRKPLPEHLERVTTVHDLSDDERPCPCCGEDRVEIARESSEQLEIEMPRLWVHRVEVVTRSCVTCRGQVQRADRPHRAIERSIAGPSVLAHLVTSKFEDHLPLYRIERILKRGGVHLARSTQSDLLRQTAEQLEPLVSLMWANVRGSPVIHTDDTEMPTIDRGRRKSGRGDRDIFKGHLWPYLGRPGVPWDLVGSYVVFRYSQSRAGEHVRDALEDWTGTIQGDCFAPYVGLDRNPERAIVLAACWAHARRGFHEARGSDPTRALHAMKLIGAMYAVERELAEREERPSPAEVAAVRAERSRPIFERLMAWIDEQRADPTVLPKSLIGRALAYVQSHRPQLERYLDDGRLAIDNSIAERSIRPVAVGRKNFLFAGSPRGGRTMATLMSVVGSARLHDVDVAAYLRDVIGRIAAMPVSRLPELLPDRWKALRSAGDEP